MTYSVYQHWDPLEVCAVGRSYSPEFYAYIENPKVREVFERIARETEEDFQKLITLLESFGVEIVRPDLSDNYLDYLNLLTNKISAPPMCPRDYSIMLGEDFYYNCRPLRQELWDQLKGTSWPEKLPSKYDFVSLPNYLKDELITTNVDFFQLYPADSWNTLIKKTQTQLMSTPVSPHLHYVNAAGYTRIGRDIYVGTEYSGQDLFDKAEWLTNNISQYRWHVVNTGGHSDSTYCPVKPGLIVSLMDISEYATTFPGWEVVYLPSQSWFAITPFLDLKEKNGGKWWVPGEELNDEFTNFVEEWMGHWVGYVEETVFDVNMLVIDEQNVVCNNYNKDVFDAFERHGITPHIINFRHRYFWDGGLHCITSDISRRGTMQDYFPERG